MQERSINRIILAKDVTMGQTSIKQPLPTSNLDPIDPFLLLHHFGPVFQEPYSKPEMDVGPHPHRGFEAVTFVIKGAVHHRDSRANESVIESGGIQWLTAGMGIVHSESIPKASLEKGGHFEIIQLWINLPSKLKMVQPKYQGFQKNDIPIIKTDDGLGRIQVFSGQYKEIKGPVNSLTKINAFMLNLDEQCEIKLAAPENQNILLYQISGLVKVNSVELGNNKLAYMNNDGRVINIKALSNAQLLYLSGDPILEKVTTYGPFVMNTQTEIMEAMRDYKMGKMGILIN